MLTFFFSLKYRLVKFLFCLFVCVYLLPFMVNKDVCMFFQPKVYIVQN